MAKRTKTNITLGSGKAYVMEYDSSNGMPTETEICVAENVLGHIKNGAELTYTAEPHKENDDLNLVSKVVVNAEEVILKLGLITWNGDTLKYLADRCKVTTEGGKRTIKIGGAGNAQGKEWVICFMQEDKKDGNLWVLIRGTNTAGLTLTFAVDAATVLEPEFTALPQDDEGTLVTIIEETGATA